MCRRKVVNQEFGLPNEGYWEGDNATSGILGLATPLLTSVFEGSDPSKDGSSALESYDPFFYNAVKQQKIKPCKFVFGASEGGAEAETDAGVMY